MESNVNTRKISIAKDFSEYPAGRYLADGPWSGEKFRNDLLAPAMEDENHEKVEVDFDDVAGFGSSFLEEAFGGLIREVGIDKATIDQKLELNTTEVELQDYVDLAWRYIHDAAKEAGQV